MRSIVVVGASLAGLRGVQALRKRGYSGRLTLLGAESHAPYDRPPLSKQLLSGEWPAEKLFFAQREQHAALDVEFRLGTRAIALDARERRVQLSDGTSLDYDGLMIATGTRARVLPNPAGLAGVFTLRTLDDSLAIRAELERGPRVAVVGAGFIGLEVAAACRKLGLAVTIVEPQAWPLLDVLGPAVGRALHALHADQGVSFRLGVSAASFEGQSRIERLVLSDGSELEVDLVVVGIGVIPETSWLRDSGVSLENGVVCDASLATNLPDVVAAGDVARWPNLATGAHARVEHWANAVEQGQAAAQRLLDGADSARAYVHAPYFWSDQYHVKFQSAGRARPDDALIVVQGALDQPQFLALYARGDRLSAVLASNRPAQFLRARKLLNEEMSVEAACSALRVQP
jgi:3-phenylpropionate/trans-cinnamate dioxygenase ferredoxin reductase subunit